VKIEEVSYNQISLFTKLEKPHISTFTIMIYLRNNLYPNARIISFSPLKYWMEKIKMWAILKEKIMKKKTKILMIFQHLSFRFRLIKSLKVVFTK